MYEEIGSNFVVTFKKALTGRKVGEGLSSEQTTQKTTRKQDAILFYLKEHPESSREEMAKNIEGITESGIKYNLKVLQDKGLLKRVGPDRGGHWEVFKND